MDRDWSVVALGCLGALALIVILIAVSALITAWVWGLIVPTVFAGAITHGLLPASLTLWQAFKLSILFWALGLTGASASMASKGKLGLGGWIVVFLVSIPIWIILTLISGFFIWLVWAWVVPDVFASAVALGMIPATLSYWHALLVSVLFGVLGLSNHHATAKSDD